MDSCDDATEIYKIMVIMKSNQEVVQETQAEILQSLADIKTLQNNANRQIDHLAARVTQLQLVQNRQYNIRGTAGERVCGVFELLETILLLLPERDLLLAQAVNIRFKAVIDGSKEIQRKLFFLPSEPTTADDNTQIHLNPLLTDRLTWTSFFERLPLYEHRGKIIVSYNPPTDANRLISNAYGFRQLSKPENGRKVVEIAFVSAKWADGLLAEIGPFRRGSFERMYLSSPPCDVRWVFTFCWKSNGSQTMGELLKSMDGKEFGPVRRGPRDRETQWLMPLRVVNV